MLLFGLVCTSLSTADSLVMSALQTIWYDIARRKEVEQTLASVDDQDRREHESRIVKGAQLLLIPIAIVSVLLFASVYVVYGANVFNFQSLMYAMPLALLTPAMFGLLAKEAEYRGSAAAAILSAIVVVIAVWGGLTEGRVNWWFNLMPLASNIVATSVFAGTHFVARMLPLKGSKL